MRGGDEKVEKVGLCLRPLQSNLALDDAADELCARLSPEIGESE